MTIRFVDDSGVVPETWEFDARGDLSSIKLSADVAPVMQAVEAERSLNGGKNGLGWHIATLHMVHVVEHAHARGISADDLLYNPAYGDELLRLCMSRDLRKFSPTEGRA